MLQIVYYTVIYVIYWNCSNSNWLLKTLEYFEQETCFPFWLIFFLRLHCIIVWRLCFWRKKAETETEFEDFYGLNEEMLLVCCTINDWVVTDASFNCCLWYRFYVLDVIVMIIIIE